ncbi:hypothetical protein BMR85_004840 [Achromobacter sp. KAs 3-5]|nr:hypothetical protein BMR85_004840 [Achromobacter sp. KAs 3-5]
MGRPRVGHARGFAARTLPCPPRFRPAAESTRPRPPGARRAPGRLAWRRQSWARASWRRHLTVLENLTLGPMWVLKKPRAEAEATAMKYLERVRIPEQAKKASRRVVRSAASSSTM